MRFIFEILFFLLILGISDIQAHMIRDNKPIRHFWWGLLFAGLIAGAWWLEDRNYWFAGALILEHFVFFAPALNFLRDPRRPFFYISSTPSNGSLWDKVLIPVERYYPFIWAAGLAAFFLIQFKL